MRHPLLVSVLFAGLVGCVPQPDCSADVQFDYNDGTPTIHWDSLTSDDDHGVRVRFDKPDASDPALACNSGAAGVWAVTGDFDSVTFGTVPADGETEFGGGVVGDPSALKDGEVYLVSVSLRGGPIQPKDSYACAEGWAFAWRQGDPDSVVACGVDDTGL